MSDMTGWLTMTEICEYLKVSRETVLNWINDRNMPSHKLGRLWRFQANEVDEWIKSGGSTDSK
jgi:excisionase family DNA binding protein